MSKQVIVDYIPFEVSPQQINESMSKNGGRLVVKGVLQRAEAKNQNGRVYPKETLMREAKKYQEIQIAERRALGELDHPDSSVVNLNNVSHNVLEMHWKDNDLVITPVNFAGLKTDGSAGTNITSDTQKRSITLMFDGDNWQVIAGEITGTPEFVIGS